MSQLKNIGFLILVCFFCYLVLLGFKEMLNNFYWFHFVAFAGTFLFIDWLFYYKHDRR